MEQIEATFKLESTPLFLMALMMTWPLITTFGLFLPTPAIVATITSKTSAVRILDVAAKLDIVAKFGRNLYNWTANWKSINVGDTLYLADCGCTAMEVKRHG